MRDDELDGGPLDDGVLRFLDDLRGLAAAPPPAPSPELAALLGVEQPGPGSSSAEAGAATVVPVVPVPGRPSAEVPRQVAEVPRHVAEVPRRSPEVPRHVAEVPRRSPEVPRHLAEVPRASTDARGVGKAAAPRRATSRRVATLGAAALVLSGVGVTAAAAVDGVPLMIQEPARAVVERVVSFMGGGRTTDAPAPAAPEEPAQDVAPDAPGERGNGTGEPDRGSSPDREGRSHDRADGTVRARRPTCSQGDTGPARRSRRTRAACDSGSARYPG